MTRDACEHDHVGPLPYDGRPADPDEWECLDCGHWNMRAPEARREDDAFAPWTAERLKDWLDHYRVPTLSPTSTVLGDFSSYATFDSQRAGQVLEDLGVSWKVGYKGEFHARIDVNASALLRDLRSVKDSLSRVTRALPSGLRGDLELSVDRLAADEVTTVVYGLADVAGSRATNWSMSEIVRDRLWDMTGPGGRGAPPGVSTLLLGLPVTVVRGASPFISLSLATS